MTLYCIKYHIYEYTYVYVHHADDCLTVIRYQMSPQHVLSNNHKHAWTSAGCWRMQGECERNHQQRTPAAGRAAVCVAGGAAPLRSRCRPAGQAGPRRRASRTRAPPHAAGALVTTSSGCGVVSSADSFESISPITRALLAELQEMSAVHSVHAGSPSTICTFAPSRCCQNII